MKIGNNIFELRTAKNLSQGQLADLLDVSRQSVSKWETGSAVPDLDKLMKLCDVFGVSLDVLTGRTADTKAEHTEHMAKNLPSQTQKGFGYILFLLSLLVALLLLFRGANAGDFLVFVPLSLSLFACGMICLFMKQRALYWCIWTALAPLTILTPHVVGFGVLTVLGAIQVCSIILMAFVAALFFKGVKVSVSRKKSVLLTVSWVAVIALYLLAFWLPSRYWLLSFLFNFVLFSAIALLETYSVCYIKSLKIKK